MRILMVTLCFVLLAGCTATPNNLREPSETVPPTEQLPIEVEKTMTPNATPPQDTTIQKTPTETPTPFRADLKDYGPAPELTNEVWLNTDQTLRLAELRGKVVLLEMWTFG